MWTAAADSARVAAASSASSAASTAGVKRSASLHHIVHQQLSHQFPQQQQQQYHHRSRLSSRSDRSSISDSSSTSVATAFGNEFAAPSSSAQLHQANQLSRSLGRLTVATEVSATRELLEDNTEIFLVENLTPLSALQETGGQQDSGIGNYRMTSNSEQQRQTAGKTEASSISSMQELLASNLLLCRKCNRLADKPVLLPCLDTLCSSCLELCSSNGDNRCPACRHPIEPSGVRTNWFLASLSNLKLCQEEGPKQLCDYCRYEDRQEPAAGLCIDCSDFLCATCSIAHGKTKMTRHHNVMSFEELAVTKQSDELIRSHQTFECPDHPGEKVGRFCATCDRLICRECREEGAAADPHAKHQMFGVDEFGRKIRDSLMGMIDNVRSKVPRLAEYGQFLDEYRLSVDHCRTQVAGDINEQADLLHRIVDECRDALLRQLNESFTKEIEDVTRKEEKLGDIKASILSGCVFSDALVNYGRDEEILWLHSLLKDRLSQFIYLQVEGISGKLSAVFNAGVSPERSLSILFGKLNLAHHPLTGGGSGSNIGGVTGSGVAASSSSGGIFSPNVTSVRVSSMHQMGGGSVAMTTKSASGTNPIGASLLPHGVRPLTEPALLLSRAQLVLEFEAKSPIDTRDIWPTGLAVSETTGDYFILDRDNKCVKSFDRQGRYRMEFGSPGSGDGSLSSPYDLAILEERLILVTDYQHEAVKAYTMQGKYLTTYRGPFKHPRGIAAMRGRQFVVADCRMRQLTIHDADSGNLIRTIRSEGLFTDPYYVTVTHDDVIVATDWAAPNLKLFDLQGNLIGQAGSYGNGTDQVLQPYGVTSDTSGQLMVADNSNHRIHLLGSDGRFVKFVVSKFDGLWHPMAIAVTPEGYLAVTEALGKVKVFKYM